MKLSDLKCRKAKAEEKLIKLADGEGLFLHVYPNGKKLWRMSYRHAGKQRDMAFGPYPEVSLLEAREKRHDARKLLRDGKDPGAQKKAEEAAAAAREETTFAAFADLYLDRLTKAGRSAPTIKKSKWIVEDLAKDLRAQQVADITPRDVLQVLRVIEAKGNRETARRMRGVLSAVFRLAVIEDVIQVDPSAPLKGALLAPETKHNSAVTEPEAFGALLRVIDGYDGHKTIKIALQLLALRPTTTTPTIPTRTSSYAAGARTGATSSSPRTSSSMAFAASPATWRPNGWGRARRPTSALRSTGTSAAMRPRGSTA
ncbi:MAG: hypothetical protein BroJett013_11860 [Alphaproteobacteria bacterium]|nr:MAG: hypothetical protein BroJett013_11860 [Alphaproteobacteria bacterium]